MTRKEQLTALAERVEGLASLDWDAMAACYEAVHGGRFDDPSLPTFEATYARWRRFKALLDAEAWLDAAMSLVPEGWGFVLASNGVDERHPDKWCANMAQSPDEEGRLTFAATPALALTAAALRAIAEGEQ